MQYLKGNYEAAVQRGLLESYFSADMFPLGSMVLSENFFGLKVIVSIKWSYQLLRENFIMSTNNSLQLGRNRLLQPKVIGE